MPTIKRIGDLPTGDSFSGIVSDAVMAFSITSFLCIRRTLASGQLRCCGGGDQSAYRVARQGSGRVSSSSGDDMICNTLGRTGGPRTSCERNALDALGSAKNALLPAGGYK